MLSKSVFLLTAIFFVLFSASAYAVVILDCNSGGRYEDMGDGTVQDCRSGLIWLKNANCSDNAGGIDKSLEVLTWYDALKWVAGLGSGLCGLTDGSSSGDWRLPTKTEWMAMVASAKKLGIINPPITNGAGTAPWNDGDVFINVLAGCSYWSSTTDMDYADYAWMIITDNRGMFSGAKSLASGWIWPVRGGQSGSFGKLIIQ